MNDANIEHIIANAARRVLARRAAQLRADAERLVTTTTDTRGRTVRIATPESVVKEGTAALFEACAADLAGGAR